MDSRQKLELLDQAIKKMLAEKKNDEEVDNALLTQDENDQLLLSKLLAEFESLKEGASSESHENKTAESLVGGGELKEDEKVGRLDSGEEIVKELRKVKRQNTVTHCLLSVMIFLTVVWQVSEVSLILKLKDGLNHPFKTLGSLLSGLVKKNPVNNIQEADKQQSPEAASLPTLQMPELPHVDLGLNGEKNSS